jgi:hypothetical protein
VPPPNKADSYIYLDKLLLQDSQLRALSRPSDSNHRTVFNWIWNTKHLDLGEFDFIYQIEDFVSLAKPRQKDSYDPLKLSWDRWPGSQIKVTFLQVFEYPRRSNINKPQKLLQGNAEKRKTRSGTTKYFSQRRLVYLTQAFITILATSMLFIPVSILFLVPMSKIWMVITVLMSSVMFSTSLFAFTNSKRQEVFLGTAT